jgi:hypothetical protein
MPIEAKEEFQKQIYDKAEDASRLRAYPFEQADKHVEREKHHDATN